MLKDFLKNNLLRPGLERLGSIAATALLVGGDWLCANAGACGLVTADGAAVVVTWVTAAALVSFDVAVIYWNRRPRK